MSMIKALVNLVSNEGSLLDLQAIASSLCPYLTERKRELMFLLLFISIPALCSGPTLMTSFITL